MCQNRHILFLISIISCQEPCIMLDCRFSGINILSVGWMLHRENLLAFEVGSCRLGQVDLFHWACQYVLVEEQEVGIFPGLDAASLVLYEHLLGTINGHGRESLFASGEFLRPPRRSILRPKYTCYSNFHDAEWVVGTAAQCRIIWVDGHRDVVVEVWLEGIGLVFLTCRSHAVLTEIVSSPGNFFRDIQYDWVVTDSSWFSKTLLIHETMRLELWTQKVVSLQQRNETYTT